MNKSHRRFSSASNTWDMRDPHMWTRIHACHSPVLHGSPLHRHDFTSALNLTPHTPPSQTTSVLSMAGRRSLRLLSSALLLLFLLLAEGTGGGLALRLNRWDQRIWMPTDKVEPEEDGGEGGTRWAVLVAGSYGFGNYRHQVSLFLVFLLSGFWLLLSIQVGFGGVCRLMYAMLISCWKREDWKMRT